MFPYDFRYLRRQLTSIVKHYNICIHNFFLSEE